MMQRSGVWGRVSSVIAAAPWRRNAVFGMAVAFIAAHQVAAQMPRTSPADSAAFAAAHAVSDTGRMMPGYRDLSRYDSPAMCEAAIQQVTTERWRRHEQDTVERQSSADTIPSVAMTIGRACAEKFRDVNTLSWLQLYSLMKLELQLRDTAAAQAAIDRRLAMAPTVAAKAEVLRSTIQILRDASPSRVGMATALFARLDALGHAARIARSEAAQDLFLMASAHYDTTAMQRYDAKLRAIGAEMTPAEQDDHDQRFTAWELPLDLAWLHEDPALPLMVHSTFAAYRTQIGNYRNGTGNVPAGLEELVTAFANQVRKPADSVTGKFWFNADDARPPRPGRVTLVMSSDRGMGALSGHLAMLRRFVRKYGPQGLDVVLVVRTQGYSWASPPQTPAAEAKTDAWYFLEYLKLPVTLLVDETPFTRNDQGALDEGMTDFRKRYPVGWGLIGRDGRLRSKSIGAMNEGMLDLFIRMALAQPSTVAQQ